MAIVVQKYGGSSVADIPRLQRVCDLIARSRENGDRLVVVVSAMAKTTEQLLELARQAAGGSDAARLPRRELDMLVSTGERVTMALLSIALQARGPSAVSFTGSQSGIITDARHFDARILEIRPERIVEQLEQDRVVIVAGYQGMSKSREITTLGRGGSDTTAVALAAVLGAERCEIYSDVDGVYTADPRVVPGARHLPRLSYAVMQAMAERGAKVLNARAVEWARARSVPVCCRCTAEFADGGSTARETRLGAAETDARAVVAEPRVALLRAPAGAENALAAALADWDAAGADRRSDASGVLLVLPLLNVPDLALLQARVRSAVPEVRVELGWSALTAVGPRSDVARFRELALAELGTSAGAWFHDELRLTAVVPSSLCAGLQRSWHEAFVAAGSARAA